MNGHYGAQIAEIIRHLEAAVPFVSGPPANELRALVQWYRTGQDADRIPESRARLKSDVLCYERSLYSTWSPRHHPRARRG